jgi:hypothetical protein
MRLKARALPADKCRHLVGREPGQVHGVASKPLGQESIDEPGIALLTRSALVVVEPETGIAWHRRGFRLW